MKITDVNVLKKAINASDDYQKMVECMKKEVTYFCETFTDSPDKLSAWGHYYFCEKDGGRLLFDLDKPNTHTCEICQTEYKSDLYDQVWVYIYRNQAIMNCWKSAILFKITNDIRYLNYVKKIIGFYADNYMSFNLHNKNGVIFDCIDEMDWGCGRLMPQGLNEAIIVIRSLIALEIVKDDLEQDFLQNIYDNFYYNAFSLLKPQVDKIHNISCWVNSAIGCIGLFFKKQEMIDYAFTGDFNIYRQLREGVTEDFFWYEGSIHYNFFTLEGITNLLLFSKLYKHEFVEEKIISNMLKAAHSYAFDNHQLPNPNDGWPNLNLKTYSYIYTVAAKALDNSSDIEAILKCIESMAVPRGILPLSRPYYFENNIPLERLTLIPSLHLEKCEQIKNKSRNFQSSNFGIIRNDTFNVFLKYGHRGPSHAHPDKMNVEILIKNNCLTRDLSNSGYGADLCNEWHRMSVSHNTVVVNGKNHLSMEPGKTLMFKDNHIKAICNNVYHIPSKVDVKALKESLNPDELIKFLVKSIGLSMKEAKTVISENRDLQTIIDEIIANTTHIDYIRDIIIKENEMNDIFTVISDDSTNNYDYFFHSQAKLVTELSYEDCDLGYSSNGYQHINNVKKVITNQDVITLEWQLGNDIIKSIINVKGKELMIAETYDNPITNHRTTIILRCVDKNAEFEITWKL